MMASAPSKIAVDTSDTSARVGTGLVIMDSSICVATTTGLPARLADRVICFCSPGTFSSGISTPRSPRATITASARSRISPSRYTACGFSILAITAARPRVIFFASAMSSGRWMKESATQSMPVSSAASRSERSFSVSAENGTVVSGRLTPLRSDNLPPTSTRVTIRLLSTSVATSLILPSSSKSVWPGSMAAKISGCGSCARLASPGAGSSSRVKISSLVSVAGPAAKLPTLSLGPCRSTRMPIGRPCSQFDRADRRHEFAHAVVAGVAHVDAEDVGACREQLRDHIAVRGRRTEGRDDFCPAQTSHQLRLRDGGVGAAGRVAGGGV